MSVDAALAGVGVVGLFAGVLTLITTIDPSYLREKARFARARQHAAPTEPLTTAQARRVIRRHPDCTVENCGLTRAARHTLARHQRRR